MSDCVSVPLRGIRYFGHWRKEFGGHRWFPSPCGVWSVSGRKSKRRTLDCSVHLRGVDRFVNPLKSPLRIATSFRPLAGCGLFCRNLGLIKLVNVSVPLRGVGCFSRGMNHVQVVQSFRPLAGCGLFLGFTILRIVKKEFPSPCGVWVVLAELHILSGATGKRIVNSAVLLYHIGRWFINSKLRNCKVPCEAHKTAT